MFPHVWVPTKSDPDILGKNLLYMANLAKSMPPSWDGAKVAPIIGGLGGENVGKVLPGRGIYLPLDLKGYGITRSIPGVFEYSPTSYLRDLLGSERGAISTYDGIIAARGNSKAFDVMIGKVSLTTVANAWSSMSRISGTPAIMTFTGISGGAVMSSTNVGSWSLGLAAPGGSDKKYILTFGYTSASQLNMIILADLLVAADTIDTNSNGSQTVNSTALTRYTSGAGVLMTFEVTAGSLGSTPANLTVTAYHNQGGTGSRATAAVAMTTSCVVGRLQPTAMGPWMQLQSGDYGVQSVETVQFSAAMGTASKYICLQLYYPLVFMPGLGTNVYAERDSTIQIDGLVELTAASGVLGCLTAYVLPNSTTTGIFTGFIRTCDG